MWQGTVLNILPPRISSMLRMFRHLRRRGVGPGLALRTAVSPSASIAIRRSNVLLLPETAVLRMSAVVDLGANVGEWSEVVLKYFCPFTLIAVEPNVETFHLLQRRLGQYSGCRLRNLAIGAEPSKTRLQITRGSNCCSLLQPNEVARRYYGSIMEVEGTGTVEVKTLDAIASDLEEVSLLKIDVQGYERQVLLGGKQTLARTNYVLVEANFVSHYEGDVLFPELHSLLSAAGFDLYRLAEPYLAGHRALWTDALYGASRLREQDCSAAH